MSVKRLNAVDIWIGDEKQGHVVEGFVNKHEAENYSKFIEYYLGKQYISSEVESREGKFVVIIELWKKEQNGKAD